MNKFTQANSLDHVPDGNKNFSSYFVQVIAFCVRNLNHSSQEAA